MSSIAPMILLKKKREENGGKKKRKNWLKYVLIALGVIAIFFIMIAVTMVSF